MQAVMRRLYPLPPSLIRYATIGMVTNGLIYLLFVLLIRAGLRPETTAGLCYTLGISFSYVLNRRWSFRSQASHRRDLPRFLFSYGVGFMATMIFISILTRWMPAEIAQLLNIGLTAITIYLCLHLTRFGYGRSPDANRNQ
jgi:putative flippase GtrA